jgi:hypothetical protein
MTKRRGEPRRLRARWIGHHARMSDDPTRAGEGGPADEDAMVVEPGVDAHIFETEWAAAWEDVPDEPVESLPVLDDIIRRMLVAARYHPDDPVASEGDEREVLDRYKSVHEAILADEFGDDPDDDEVADAIEALTDVYRTLTAQLRGPGEVFDDE